MADELGLSGERLYRYYSCIASLNDDGKLPSFIFMVNDPVQSN